MIGFDQLNDLGSELPVIGGVFKGAPQINLPPPDESKFKYGANVSDEGKGLLSDYGYHQGNAEMQANAYMSDSNDARAQSMGLMGNVANAEASAYGNMGAAGNAYGQMGQQLGMANGAVAAGWGARSDAGDALAQSQQARGMQAGLMNSYNDVLSGNAPSVAQAQMQAGLDKANQSAMGMAASTRGGGANALLAMRQAGMQQQANSLGAINDMTALRAREMDMARSGAGALAGQMRSGDYNLAQGYQAQRAQDLGTAAAYQNTAQGFAQQGAGYGALANTGVNLMGANQASVGLMQGQQKIDADKAGMQYGQQNYWNDQKTNVYTQSNNAAQNYETLKSNQALGVATSNQQAQTADTAAKLGGGAVVLSSLSGKK